MPAGKRRSLRRSGSIVALGFACLVGLVPVSFGASSPAPDPPPVVVAPDPQPEVPVVETPRRPREAPVVVQAPAARSVPSARVATTAPAPVVKKPARSAAPPPVTKRPAVRKPAPASSPSHFVPRDIWALQDVRSAPRAAGPTAEVLERRRLALAGVVLALVAVGGGVLLGVGGRTLREGIA